MPFHQEEEFVSPAAVDLFQQVNGLFIGRLNKKTQEVAVITAITSLRAFNYL